MKTRSRLTSIGLAYIASLTASILSASPSSEQADSFYSNGTAAEKQGEPLVAKNCYQLALRAEPGHKGALAALSALARKEAEGKLAEGGEAEGKGDLASANLLYLEALRLAPDHPEAKKRTAALKMKMGAAFREGSALFIESKLRKIIIPRIDFMDTNVEEAVDFFRLRSRELDVEEADASKKGINFIIRKPSGQAGNSGELRIRELRLRNVPLEQAIKYVCDQAKLVYEINDFSVVLTTRDSQVESKPAVSSQAGNPAQSAPVVPPEVPTWFSKDGRKLQGAFVGLDGEAVVVKKDGKEVTIPFAKLAPASVAQAKSFGDGGSK